MGNILKISAWIDQRGYDFKATEIEVSEKEKCFVSQKRRIKKTELMKIKTIFLESHKTIRYYIYCLPDDKQKALEMINKHIIDKVQLYKSEIDAISKFLPNQ